MVPGGGIIIILLRQFRAYRGTIILSPHRSKSTLTQMVDLQSVSLTLGGLALTLGVAYMVYFTRQHMAVKKAELETRRAEHHLSLVKYITDEKFDDALTEILWRWQWSSYDEYWEKYSPLKNPQANVTRRVARSYYNGLAALVRRGLLDLELLYELNPSGVQRYWEKMGPIALEFRRRNDYPDYLEPVEYLANEMRALRERKGLATPKPVTA